MLPKVYSQSKVSQNITPSLDHPICNCVLPSSKNKVLILDPVLVGPPASICCVYTTQQHSPPFCTVQRQPFFATST